MLTPKRDEKDATPNASTAVEALRNAYAGLVEMPGAPIQIRDMMWAQAGYGKTLKP